jgi:hypothetical protein
MTPFRYRVHVTLLLTLEELVTIRQHREQRVGCSNEISSTVRFCA